MDIENYKEFEKYWHSIIYNEDGTPNIEQIKKELYDYSVLLDFVSKVYCDITGGRILKPFTFPDVVIAGADDNYNQIANDWHADECKYCEHRKELIWYKKFYKKLQKIFKGT